MLLCDVWSMLYRYIGVPYSNDNVSRSTEILLVSESVLGRSRLSLLHYDYIDGRRSSHGHA